MLTREGDYRKFFTSRSSNRRSDCIFSELNTTPPILCLRFTGSLAVAAQDSRPRRIATPLS